MLVKQGSGLGLLVINEAMCSVKFGIALVAQNMLGNGLDDPVILWLNVAQSDSQSLVERRDPHS